MAEDFDFEIKFYEGIIERKPDFIEALSALGDLYTKKGLFEQGLKIDQRLAALRPDNDLILYNLACSYSLTNNLDASLQTIKKAIECGYRDFRFLEKDNDLVNLRRDSRFQEFWTSLKTRHQVDPQKKA